MTTVRGVLLVLALALVALPVSGEDGFSSLDEIQGTEVSPASNMDKYLEYIQWYKDAVESLRAGNGFAGKLNRSVVDLRFGIRLEGDERSAGVDEFLGGRDLGSFGAVKDLVKMGNVRVYKAETVDALKTHYTPEAGDLLIAGASKTDQLPSVVAFVFSADGRISAVHGMFGAKPKKVAAPKPVAGGGGAEGSGGNGGGTGTGKHTLANTHYWYHVPKSYSGKATPLVIHCHGAGSSADREIKLFIEASEESGFIAVVLKSVGQTYILSEGANLVALREDCQKKWNIDNKRIYMTGFSAGGVITIFFNTTSESQYIAAMGIWNSPYQPQNFVWRPRNEAEEKDAENVRKLPAWFSSNSGDPNFQSCQRWAKFFEDRGHKTTFTDESARLSKHTYDRTTVKECFAWMSKFSLK
jgi:predicted esterase